MGKKKIIIKTTTQTTVERFLAPTYCRLLTQSIPERLKRFHRVPRTFMVIIMILLYCIVWVRRTLQYKLGTKSDNGLLKQ